MSERDYIFAKADRAFDEISKALNPFKAVKQARETRAGMAQAALHMRNQGQQRALGQALHHQKYKGPASLNAVVKPVQQQYTAQRAYNVARGGPRGPVF